LVDYDAYRGFLEAQIARYRKVLQVLGNHGFYGQNYESGFDAAQRLADEPSLASGLEEVAWLREEVKQVRAGPARRRNLIATHHAPCIEGTSRAEHAGNPWTSAVATDLVDQVGRKGVKVWMFGPTHYSNIAQRDQAGVKPAGVCVPGRSEGGGWEGWL